MSTNMKLVTKNDYRMAGAQYCRGVTDYTASPANQPNPTGACPHYYMEGHSDARVSPRSLLGDEKLPFGVLTGEADDSGLAFTRVLRRALSTIGLEIGQSSSTQVQQIMATLNAATESELGKVDARAQNEEFFDKLSNDPESLDRLLDLLAERSEERSRRG